MLARSSSNLSGLSLCWLAILLSCPVCLSLLFTYLPFASCLTLVAVCSSAFSSCLSLFTVCSSSFLILSFSLCCLPIFFSNLSVSLSRLLIFLSHPVCLCCLLIFLSNLSVSLCFLFIFLSQPGRLSLLFAHLPFYFCLSLFAYWSTFSLFLSISVLIIYLSLTFSVHCLSLSLLVRLFADLSSFSLIVFLFSRHPIVNKFSRCWLVVFISLHTFPFVDLTFSTSPFALSWFSFLIMPITVRAFHQYYLQTNFHVIFLCLVHKILFW